VISFIRRLFVHFAWVYTALWVFCLANFSPCLSQAK